LGEGSRDDNLRQGQNAGVKKKMASVSLETWEFFLGIFFGFFQSKNSTKAPSFFLFFFFWWKFSSNFFISQI
jgi:hypothetical protein